MQTAHIIFFITTGFFLADAIYSLFTVKFSLENYNLEIKARHEYDEVTKQNIVNTYVSRYGAVRTLLKLIGGLCWYIAGFFTSFYLVLIVLILIRFLFRLVVGNNRVDEFSYYIRLASYISLYVYILQYYSTHI